MIYFLIGVEDGQNLVKIGYTSKPLQERIQALQCGSPCTLSVVMLLEGGKADEIALHGRFRKYRHHGEWFHPGPELVAFVKECVSEELDRLAQDVLADPIRLGNLAANLGWPEHEVRQGIVDICQTR